MNKIYFLSFILFFFLSCGNQKEEKTAQQSAYQLIKKSTLNISIDSTVDNSPINTQFFQEKELVILNRKDNSLLFYPFQDKSKISKKILLEKEGNNSVGQITDFVVHTEDSIFVLNSGRYTLYMLNKNGKVMETYKILKGKVGQETAMPDPFPFHPLIYENGKVYITGAPDRNPMKDDYYVAKSLLIEVNLKTKDFQYKYSFPEVYRKNIYPHNLNMTFRTYSKKHNKFIYSFPADNHIQVTNHQTDDENKQYLANSAQLQEVIPTKKRILDPVESSRVGNSMSVFGFVHYDNHRDLFYRAFAIRTKDNKEIISKDGLIILDTDFNKIGEIAEIPKENSFLNPIFTKEGMWLMRQESKEGFITYDLFELTKK